MGPDVPIQWTIIHFFFKPLASVNIEETPFFEQKNVAKRTAASIQALVDRLIDFPFFQSLLSNTIRFG